MPGRTVLLTGASGLVGTWLRRLAPDDVELVCWHHRTAIDAASVSGDLRDADAVQAAFAATRPAVVIHAAMALDAASIVDATRNVALAAAVTGTDVVSISTDAVFAGDGQPVDEDARPDPVSDYGRWKAEAEQCVRSGPADWALIRLPLVVSLDPDDPVVTKIRAGAADRTPTQWFDDETRQPARAADLTRAIWAIAALGRTQRAGVWHLPGPERLSRFEIAQRVTAALGLPADCVMAAATPPELIRPRRLHLLADRAHHQIGWAPSPVLR